MNKQEYAICQERKHVKSGQKVNEEGVWDVCKYCGVLFRYVTKLEEKDAQV